MIRNVEVGWRRGEEEGVIPVEIIRSGRRTLGLEINGEGHVCVRIPQRLGDRQVMEFIKERQNWIVQKWFLTEQKRRTREQRPLPDYLLHPEREAVYRNKARAQLEARTAYYADRMGVTYNRISIRAAKTRWGSCSAKGSLNFHWKLILMPPDVLDYVVVHELAHRREMNHSPRFWAEVERILPDYRQSRKWLKEYGAWV